ncbi:MAG: hypothetical protein MUF72_17925 [Elainella sp. Prado103]|jgi:hypothetical protein|nr:hypothetical protein [Elainella sp. Prado103]
MPFFNSSEPILRFKQETLDFQDQVGLWQIHWQWGDRTISRFYTRIDQIFLLWGMITALIFGVAQFCQITWTTQALVWTGLTLLGVLGMGLLAWFWVSVERLRWLIYSWAGLMILGILYTDLCILAGQWQLSPYLCSVWLGLSALGYLLMGWGMRSRTFLLTAGFHLSAIPLLPYTGHWQFIMTGLVIAGCLLFLSEVQWDMRPPIEFAVLTVEQRQFNHTQQQKRRIG